MSRCRCGTRATKHRPSDLVCATCGLTVASLFDEMRPIDQRTAHNLRIDPSVLGDEVPLSQDSQDKVDAAMYAVSPADPGFNTGRARELIDIVVAGGPRAANAADLVAEQLRAAISLNNRAVTLLAQLDRQLTIKLHAYERARGGWRLPDVLAQLRHMIDTVTRMERAEFTSPLSVAEAQFLLDLQAEPQLRINYDRLEFVNSLELRGYVRKTGQARTDRGHTALTCEVTEAGKTILEAMKR